jgi:hypothetical protein
MRAAAAALVLAILALGPPVRARADDATSPPRTVAASGAESEQRRLAALLEALAPLREWLASDAQGNPDAAAALERLAALESRLAAVEQELRRLADESRGTADGVEALSRAEQKRVNLSVYGNLDASGYSGERPLLDGRIFELVLSGHPHPRISVLGQVEFEHAAEVGGRRGGEVIVEQAFAALNLSPLASFRAGVFLVPFGNLNVDHFPSSREVVNRPLVSHVLAPADWTDNGIGLFGKRLVGESWLFTYEAWLMAGLGGEVSALGLRETRQGYGVDNNHDKALALQLALNRGGRAMFGISAYTGKYDDLGRQRLVGIGAHGLVTLGALRLTGEYARFDAARSDGPDARLRGHYLRGVYSLGRSLLARTRLGSDFEEPRLALAAEHDRVTIDGPLDGRFVRNRESRSQAGLVYRPASQWSLKLGYEWNSASNLPLVKGDRDGWVASVAFVF